jgi:serine phosphatase RsbU (regulator of sigma subunit)
MEGRRKGSRFLKKRPGLQLRMTFSYVVVSVASALLLELLVVGIFFLVILRLPFVDQSTRIATEQTAQIYALEAAVQANGDTLNPRSTFQPGQPTSLVLPGADSSEIVPYTAARSSSSQAPEFGLLIAPNGQIVASSYPSLYPPSTSPASLLPDQARIIRNALAGKADNTVDVTAQGNILSLAQPVLNRENKAIGAIYIQTPSQAFNGSIFSVVPFLLFTGLFWLVLLVPIGAIFGLLTTRGLVRRIHRLVSATGKFASGDYTQRVPTKKQDEIGLLERQFNTMAEQLVESIAQQKLLVEQQARQEERARIEQEMRTARVIQISLLPKELPTLPGWQIATYYQAAREVGGDLYDFLPFEDGRLGLVIGDVTDKGMPAALVMASARSMLRAAARATDSPGEVLARVNNLLSADIPAKMFVTCFYAILDPGSGRLRFANAGQDLPYCQRAGSAYELRATGMPLGLMPGMRYEEQEVILDQNENILFYTDGLVEAHNPGREMFGFPRLKSLLAEHTDGASLIDFLLNELKCFTGDEWEQEDDITILTLLRMPE